MRYSSDKTYLFLSVQFDVFRSWTILTNNTVNSLLSVKAVNTLTYFIIKSKKIQIYPHGHKFILLTVFTIFKDNAGKEDTMEHVEKKRKFFCAKKKER